MSQILQKRRLEQIFGTFRELSDPRVAGRCAHDLFAVVVMAVCAAIADCNSWHDVARFAAARREFFESFLDLPNGTPSHDTFSRLFRLLDTPQFLEVMRQWITQFADMIARRKSADSTTADCAPQIAVDGKTCRGARRQPGLPHSALQLVNAWSVDNHIVLGQLAVDGDSNEIAAVPELLRALNLKGAVVTIDAAHCQKETLQTIVDKEGDFVVAVKGNQPKLHKAVMDAFENEASAGFTGRTTRRHTTVESKNDGAKTVTREYAVMRAPKAVCAALPDVATIGMVVTRTADAAAKAETGSVRYFVSSLPARVKAFAKYVRGHWRIETELHWSLDVTFREDASTIRADAGPMNTAILRRLALSIVKQDTSINDNVFGKRRRAAFSEDALASLLAGFSRCV